ncbi:hypothetical protein AhSzw1_131 [Aeromonas phage AhSzw-1]|uniref:Uncharacterized protein n=1 Tax=Aeromonas phage AhSzw-1 TaxID=2138299 RepID=A0A2R4AM94_9CAUD|nr:hypothetical protein HOT04_gp131 [Aeromonas phage AhSzw-1]AVR76167.1 hypothetical protein AhSzw1_131 [Aeromonas phage AhSzw-1]
MPSSDRFMVILMTIRVQYILGVKQRLPLYVENMDLLASLQLTTLTLGMGVPSASRALSQISYTY